jgi:hypothetical protein
VADITSGHIDGVHLVSRCGGGVRDQGGEVGGVSIFGSEIFHIQE